MEKLFDEDKEPLTTAVPQSVKTERRDSYTNAITSLGTTRDKKMYGTFVNNRIMDPDFLVSLYVNDGLVSTIVDCIPDTAFKNFGYVQNDPDDEYDEGIITRELNRLNAAAIFKQAAKWNRLLGGAIIFVGATGAGKPDTPLKLERIKNIEFLKVYPSSEIILTDSLFETDMLSPNFGKVSKYHVKIRVGSEYSEAWLHASRCIPMFGIQVPSGTTSTFNLKERYWGLSILQKMWEDIRDYRMAISNINTLIQESSISVYNFNDLDEILAAGNEAKFQARISAIQLTKSAINAVLLGTDETYQRENLTFTGLPEIIDKLHEQLSCITGIPVSKLFGASPGGLNATGGAEERTLNDQAIAVQKDLSSEIQKFIDMIVVWKSIDSSADHSWKWNSLIELTDLEKANLARLEAETNATKAREVNLSIGDGVLSTDDAYKMEYEERLGVKADKYFDDLEPDPVDPNGGDPTKAKVEKGVDAGNS